jgi:hypothetical protein
MTDESTETTTQQEEADKFWEGHDPNQPRLDALTAEALTPMVRRATGRETATVTTWQYRMIKGAEGDKGAGRGVYRFWGRANNEGGEELAPLVVGGPGWEFTIAELRAMDAEVFAGYLDGLRDANWRGDPRLVRLGLVLSAPLRYAFGYVGLLDYLESMDEEHRAWLQSKLETFLEKSFPFIVVRRHFELELAEEAADLLETCAPQIAAL